MIDTRTQTLYCAYECLVLCSVELSVFKMQDGVLFVVDSRHTSIAVSIRIQQEQGRVQGHRT